MKKVYGSKGFFIVALILFSGSVCYVWVEPKTLIPWLCLIFFGFFMAIGARSAFIPLFTFDGTGIQWPGFLGIEQKKFYGWNLVEKIDDQFAGKPLRGYVIRMGKTTEFVVQRYSYTDEDIAVLSGIIQNARNRNPNLIVSPGLLAKAGLSETFTPSRSPVLIQQEADRVSILHPTPVVTYLLLSILSVIFLLELAFKLDSSSHPLSPGINSLVAFGAVSRNLVLGHGDWFRLLTAMLLHADPLHILGNAVALYFAGAFLEEYFGRAWFFALFALGGLAGTMSSILFNSPNTVSLGASGAIMGLLAADFILAFRLPPGSTKVRAQALSIRILLPSLLPQLSHVGKHVDISAHLGGAVAGTVLGLFLLIFWRKGETRPPFSRPAQVLCLVALGAFALAGFKQFQVYESTRQVLDRNLPSTYQGLGHH